LLEQLPEEQAWEVEEYLEKLAGDKAPSEINKDPFSWKAVASAWTTWWTGDKSKVVMMDAAGPLMGGSLRGYTLLVQLQTNSITELDANGKPRWSLTGLMQPIDAEVVSGQRVLVVEQGGGGLVSERTFQGKILWQKQFPQPSTVQRLRNGNTLITCRNQLIEVNRIGNEVRKIDVRGGRGRPIVAARKLPNGHFVAFDRGDLIHLDPKGRELNRVVELPVGGNGNNEVLDNGHVLVLTRGGGGGNLIEFDIDGKEILRFDMQGADHAFRLPNGHTLLLVNNGTKYLELDKKWKTIKETPLMTPAFRVKRR
jgi:PQQ-like domain